MKRSLLALAALTAFAGAASAQSSVTVFGIVDLAARNQNNGNGSINSLSSAGINTSRLGFRGIEDLGGGLRAGFWLEGQLDPDTGNAGGQTWQRRSTVSLIGGFGEVVRRSQSDIGCPDRVIGGAKNDVISLQYAITKPGEGL